MRRGGWLAAWSLAAALSAASAEGVRPAPAAGETPAAPAAALSVGEVVDVRLRQVYATVTRRGQRALDLEGDDFVLRQGNKVVPLVTFARGDVPFTAVIALDASVSMAGRPLALALDAARSFVGSMAQNDEAQVLLFADQIVRFGPLASAPHAALAALAGAQADGGSAVYDALLAANQLAGERFGRRVLLLLSDGVDLHSVVRAEDLRPHLQRTGALVYWIRLPPALAPAAQGEPVTRQGAAGLAAFPALTPASSWWTRQEAGQQFHAFERLVARSGGRVIEIDDFEHVQTAFAEVLRELREQYVLGYESAAGGPPVAVGIRPRGYEVRLSTWGRDAP